MLRVYSLVNPDCIFYWNDPSDNDHQLSKQKDKNQFRKLLSPKQLHWLVLLQNHYGILNW